MGTKHALKDVKIKDANIPRISMCGGGCGQGYHYDPPSTPSCGGCGLGLVDSLKYLYNKAISTITPKPKEKTAAEILAELKKKYPKELFDEYDYIQGMWIKKNKN